MKLVIVLFLSLHLTVANARVGGYIARRSTKPMMLREYGSSPQQLLGLCEGDCDNDGDCISDDLVCFQRGAYEEVPGCLGGLQDGSLTDYCVLKNDKETGVEPVPLMYTMNFPLGRCEGDCDTNADCQGNLICFQRNENEAVPGCIGGERDGSRSDYCVSPPSSSVEPPKVEPPKIDSGLKVHYSNNFPLSRCQGDCDTDFDCDGGLVCFQRTVPNTAVPGCDGGESDASRSDYCVLPGNRAGANTVPTPPIPIIAPTPPTPAPVIDKGELVMSTNFPLGRCEGDCDSNEDCEDGMICWHRAPGESIQGCRGEDPSGTDYCIPKEDAPAQKLRLYWDPSYFWQESKNETFWCMTCTACQNLTSGDGWEGGCVEPENNKCDEGHLIWIQRCRETYKRFDILENPNSGNQIRVYGTNLCLSSIRNRFIELRTCDKNIPNQLWAKMPDRDKFEIRPYHQRNRNVNDAWCLSQLHHPKPTEVIALRPCRENINHETNYWSQYYG